MYIGSSGNSIKTRWRKHLYHLRKNNHHSKHLQASWNKYGPESFKFEIIELCESSISIQREQYYIDTLKPQYNTVHSAGRPLGMKHTEEFKKKVSERFKGNKYATGNTNNRGKKLTEEQKAYISLKVRQSGFDFTRHKTRKIKDNLGNEYFSIAEASRITCIKQTTISMAIKNNRKTRNGKIFNYVLEDK